MRDFLAGWQEAVGRSPMGEAVSGVVWVKALLESAHILAMGLVLFAVAASAVRLMRPFAGPDSAAATASRFASWIWSALAFVALTGLLLLTGAGLRRGVNTPMFQLKMGLMLAAVLATALLLHLGQSASRAGPGSRWGPRALALVCLLLWAATVCAGRWLAYGYVLFPDA